MEITNDLLTPNYWSRPTKPVGKILGIAMHWVENPGTSAKFNRDYFELRRDGNLGFGSTHYLVDKQTILRAIPDDEMAYHVGANNYRQTAIAKFGPYPNSCTLGIELCHKNWDGEFEPETLENALELLRYLCRKFNLSPVDDICRHYDVTGKNCPKWFVDHPEEFDLFKGRV